MTPRKIEQFKSMDVIDLSFDPTHTLFLVNETKINYKINDLCQTGNVYICGLLDGFQTDYNKNRKDELILSPKKLQFDCNNVNDKEINFKIIFAGENNTILIDDKNNIYLYGKDGKYKEHKELKCFKGCNSINSVNGKSKNNLLLCDYFSKNNLDITQIMSFKNNFMILCK